MVALFPENNIGFDNITEASFFTIITVSIDQLRIVWTPAFVDRTRMNKHLNMFTIKTLVLSF